MHLNIEAESVNGAYLKLLDEFSLGDDKYESKAAIISIKNIYNSELPRLVIEPYNKYYQVFIQNDLLEQKWNLLDEEWYLSYSRRIMTKRNGIDIWKRAKMELLRNENSRRSIILTYRDEDDLLGYLPSLLSIQFTIENNMLNMLTMWRSKELYIAFPINILSMHSLMRIMYNEIRKQCYTLKMGIYTEFVGSLHKLPENKKPKEFGDSLINMNLEKVKFYWSVLENGKEKEYDENY